MRLFIVVGTSILLSQSLVLAADVTGQAFKYGSIEHDGITIRIETIPEVPAVSVLGAGMLLLTASLLLCRSGKKTSRLWPMMTACLGLACVGHAFTFYSAMTSASGEWGMTGVDVGHYSLEASADGYYSVFQGPISITAGMNTLPDFILYPIETPTPSPTADWTNTPLPTETPVETPTEVPATATDTPTEIPPTATPTSTPGDPTQTPVITMTPTATPTTPAPGDECAVDGIVGVMRCVLSTGPTGFVQGSPSGEACRDSGEGQFTHILTSGFLVMETEITRSMWSALKALQSTLPVDPSDTDFSPTTAYPVQNATWYEAVLFANLLSVQNGFSRCYFKDSSFSTPVDSSNYSSGSFFCDFTATGYRLPTEGEWEYFCRAGTTGAFSCTESNYNATNCVSCSGVHYTLEDYCTYCGNNSYRTDPAGSRLANPWNLKDVHGNVMEWCWDWRVTYPTGTQTDYRGTASGTFRVSRGGGWEDTADDCRSAERGTMNTPGFRGDRQGFRLVRDVQS